jgi:uncharacterized protein (TIGR02600 family)
MVLTALALVSFLALVILTFARNEDRAAKTNSDLDQLQTLAALPEKMVIHQIRQATDRLISSGSDGTLVADSWTSQPGLIRRFSSLATETDGTTGRVPTREVFKLYSSPQMYYNTNGNPVDAQLAAESTAIQQWATNAVPGPFLVDLNEPVPVSSIRQQSSNTRNLPDLRFPIADPRALGKVDGFALVTTSSAGAPPVLSYQPPQNNLRLPMPVSWLYVLRDGTVLPVEKVVDAKTISVNKGIATEENPIVGRIAFWADDDSCKLNINTASEPSPWAPPVANTPADRAYAQAMPAAKEYHRMPGHPAFTSLSPVFRHFGNGGSDQLTVNNITSEKDKHREVFDPLVSTGVNTWDNDVKRVLAKLPRTIKQDGGEDTAGSMSGTQPVTAEVTLREQRLFTSIDELLFNPLRERNGNTRQEDLEQLKFFLTPHSRAPETNLFNQPKISLWPLPYTFAQHTELDQKFAFSSFIPSDIKVGGSQTPNSGNIYAFQRGDPWGDPAATPGLLGSAQDPFVEFTLQRNQELFSYLQTLTNSAIPGFGSSPVEKYGDASRDQLLLSIFDYLRWGVNPQTAEYSEGVSLMKYRYLPPSPLPVNGDNPTGLGENSATALKMLDGAPLDIDSPDIDPNDAITEVIKSYGRSHCVSEVALVFSAIDSFSSSSDNGFYNSTKEILCFVIIEPFQVAPGVPSASPQMRYLMSWAGDPTLNVDSTKLELDFANDLISPLPSSPIALHDVVYSPSVNPAIAFRGNAAPFGGLHSFFLRQDGSFRPFTPLPNFSADPKIGNNFCATCTLSTPGQGNIDNKIEFSGGTLTLDVLALESDEILQRLVVTFPPCKMPMPKLKTSSGITIGSTQTDRLEKRAERFLTSPGVSTERPLCLIEDGDVVRSMEFTSSGTSKGDYRMMAGRVVNNTAVTMDFKPAYNTDLTAIENIEQAHSLRDGAVQQDPNSKPTSVSEPSTTDPASPAQPMTLLAGTIPALSSIPALPPGTNGVFNADGQLGDFDNGPGLIEDGPYLGFVGISSVANESTPSADNGVGYFDFATRGTTPAEKVGLSRGGPALEEDGLTFAPWNQISSGIAFGSLPTGIYGRGSLLTGTNDPTPRPWQTLLFCPHPASRTNSWALAPEWLVTDITRRDHFGFAFPRDHLWLENFWMPAVEPAHLAGLFATEGKVNMNHQMIPFTWIHRSTALHGALHGVRITAIPTARTLNLNTPASDPRYKDPNNFLLEELRYSVDPDLTMVELDKRFNQGSDGNAVLAGDVYRSPSEICEVPLFPVKLPRQANEYPLTTPDPTNLAELQDWWEGVNSGDLSDGMEATGDNTRERPYAQLYPRLCTRSNVFTVHYRVQIISTARSQGPNVFVEDADGRNIIAEQRGSATVERYLDPSNQQLNGIDFLTNGQGLALDDYYSYRVINRQTFAP